MSTHHLLAATMLLALAGCAAESLVAESDPESDAAAQNDAVDSADAAGTESTNDASTRPQPDAGGRSDPGAVLPFDASPDGPPPPPPPPPGPPSAEISDASVRAAVLQTIVLEPVAPQNGVEFRWTVIDAPAGSSTRPVEALGPDPRSPLTGATEDDPATPEARLFIDVVGTYTVALAVVTPDGEQDDATAIIEAWSRWDIHIEMSWHTPADENETDTTGSDVDLHLRHPSAARWNTQGDCYYANPNPDWGAQGDGRDDPALDLDDINGAGPENIHLDRPEEGGVYTVGVDYYRQESLSSFTGYGPSFVTVRVYLSGELAWVNDVPKELVQTHQFWDVGEVIWSAPLPRFRVIDALSPAHEAAPVPPDAAGLPPDAHVVPDAGLPVP